MLNDHDLQQIRDIPLISSNTERYILQSHNVTTHIRSGRHYAYSSSFTSTNATNKLGYNPSYLHHHYYNTQYPHIFPLQPFLKHLLHNLKTDTATSPSQPTIEPSKLHNEASTSSDENTSSNVLFSTYALHQSK